MRNLSLRVSYAAVACVAWSMLFGNLPALRAEDVRQDELNEKAPSIEKAASYEQADEVNKMLRGNVPANKQAFADYFGTVLYPHWTRFDNKDKLAKWRQIFQQKFYNPAKNQQAFDFLNEVTLATMKKYATGNYQFETRYHALLFIGEVLNSSLPGIRPVVPLPAALTVLVEAAGDEKLPDAVRVAAFPGIRRHLAAHPSEETKKMVADAMLAIVNGPAAKDNNEDAVRIEAARVADALGNDNPEVKALLTTSKPTHE